MPNVEVIVVDDGSSDGTSHLAKELVDCYGPDLLRWFRFEENRGAPTARNLGVQVARGGYLLFVDSDDLLIAEGISILIESLESDQLLDYAYGKVVITDCKLNPIATIPPCGSVFVDTPVEIAGYHWHTMGALYRKSYLCKVGKWNEMLTGSQDWEFQARIKLAKGRRKFVDTNVGLWRQHDGFRVGASKFRPDYIRSVMEACSIILHSARDSGFCDTRLERRIARKLFVHALEWGASDRVMERRECLYQARDCLSKDPIFYRFLSIFATLPTTLDASIQKRIRECFG